MGKALSIAAGAAEIAGGVVAGISGNPLLASQLVMAGVSTEIGALQNARAATITTRTPASPRQIIYGEQRVGGVMVYESTTGSHFDQYNMVIVLATHEIDSIVNLYLDGRRVNWQVGSGGNVTRNGVNFGGSAGGGEFIGPGGQTYNFDTLVYCEARFGDQADGDIITGLTANDPNWAASSAGSPYLGGIAYVYLKVEYDSSMFPSQPEVKFTIRGKNNIYDPRIAASESTTPTVLSSPTTLLNGWGPNAHVGYYEGSSDQGRDFGTADGTTLPYNNPTFACDSNLSTASSVEFQGTHSYAGCVWSFAANTGTAPTSLWLNINSSVNPLVGTGRSSSIWYSLDGGSTWAMLYDTNAQDQQWQGVELSVSQDWSKVQVMAFTDAHDDMAHYVNEIQLATAQQSNGTGGTGLYTNNWALVVADVLSDTEWGLGDGNTINQDQLIAAANVCDEQVTLASGGSEAQWTCNYHYNTSTSPGDVLEAIMPAAAGRLSRIGGEWFIWPAYWQGPSFSWDASILAGKVTWRPFRKTRDLYNRVRGTYIAPNFPYSIAGDEYDTNGWYFGTTQDNFPFAWQPTNYPDYAADELHGYGTDIFLEQDKGNQYVKEVTQSAVISVAQAQRAGKVLLFRNRQQGTGDLIMQLRAYQAQPVDVLQLAYTSRQVDLSTKQLEISAMQFVVEEDDERVQSLKIQASVQETDQSTYEWFPEEEELSVYDVPANPQQGSPLSVPPPTALVLTSNNDTALIGSDGIATPRLLVSWTPATDTTVTSYNIQYRATGTTTWLNASPAAGNAAQAYLTGVVGGQSYDVQVQAVRPNGASSTFASATVVATAPNSTTNAYTMNPSIDLSNPTTTTVVMGSVSVTFGVAGNTVTYKTRTFPIPLPTSPTWYYVTIADAEQSGDPSSGTLLTATCQTSDALVGVKGNTYIGSIQVVPEGGSVNVLAGGWPAPSTFIVGD